MCPKNILIYRDAGFTTVFKKKQVPLPVLSYRCAFCHVPEKENETETLFMFLKKNQSIYKYIILSDVYLFNSNMIIIDCLSDSKWCQYILHKLFSRNTLLQFLMQIVFFFLMGRTPIPLLKSTIKLGNI